ncbi:hypothetical protein LSH36_138g05004 [Paralvinella palmiformis]|uniref:G-protein coupled receptors family 1 profile domain-containing protein n=1 Tax=Paralvinella palmiformis TaxID=53620 RepID=A0AAD9JWL8_9ANNE|nr:hypothetical protein LSH36_138g05004 [Paralvinella palmiformis]
MDMPCDMLYYLNSIFGQKNNNNSVWKTAILEAEGCADFNSTSPPHSYDTVQTDEHGTASPQYGVLIYAFVTPIIVFVGVLGNVVSLRVFFSRNLRKLSASVYLAAISVSDLMVLLIYVSLDWLRKGLPHYPGGHSLGWIINSPGICETFLYFSYLFRFVSVWLIVVFTVERYIAACRPLQRRVICTKSFGRRAIMVVILLGGLISLYKPIISGIYSTTKPDDVVDYRNNNNNNNNNNVTVGLLDVVDFTTNVCRSEPGYENINFSMELMFGLSITAVPFVVIAFFNALILRTLMQRDVNIKRWKLCFKESRIRWEFTVTLLVVSTAFICLNLPYFITWCQRNLLSTSGSTEDGLKSISTRDQFYITLTIYYVNYCINFFLYCLTGTYYRRELRLIFCCGPERRGYQTRGSVASFSGQPTALTNLKEMSRM